MADNGKRREETGEQQEPNADAGAPGANRQQDNAEDAKKQEADKLAAEKLALEVKALKRDGSLWGIIRTWLSPLATVATFIGIGIAVVNQVQQHKADQERMHLDQLRETDTQFENTLAKLEASSAQVRMAAADEIPTLILNEGDPASPYPIRAMSALIDALVVENDERVSDTMLGVLKTLRTTTFPPGYIDALIDDLYNKNVKFRSRLDDGVLIDFVARSISNFDNPMKGIRPEFLSDQSYLLLSTENSGRTLAVLVSMELEVERKVFSGTLDKLRNTDDLRWKTHKLHQLDLTGLICIKCDFVIGDQSGIAESGHLGPPSCANPKGSKENDIDRGLDCLRLRNAVLVNSTFRGISARFADFRGAHLESTSFTNCILQGTTFLDVPDPDGFDAKVEDELISHGRLPAPVSFEQSDLSGGDLSGRRISFDINSHFIRPVPGVDIEHPFQYGLWLSEVKTEKTTFNDPQLTIIGNPVDTNFQRCARFFLGDVIEPEILAVNSAAKDVARKIAVYRGLTRKVDRTPRRQGVLKPPIPPGVPPMQVDTTNAFTEDVQFALRNWRCLANDSLVGLPPLIDEAGGGTCPDNLAPTPAKKGM